MGDVNSYSVTTGNQCIIEIIFLDFLCQAKFSPLVWRCDGTTVGLGYWKVWLAWHHDTLPGQWVNDSTIKLGDVAGLAKIFWLPFRYRFASASDVWLAGSSTSWGGRLKISATDCVTLKDHRFDVKTTACPSLFTYTVCDENPRKPLISLIKRQPGKPYHTPCDDILVLPWYVMYCMKDNKCKKEWHIATKPFKKINVKKFSPTFFM
jgi:hypothetical protein